MPRTSLQVMRTVMRWRCGCEQAAGAGGAGVAVGAVQALAAACSTQTACAVSRQVQLRAGGNRGICHLLAPAGGTDPTRPRAAAPASCSSSSAHVSPWQTLYRFHTSLSHHRYMKQISSVPSEPSGHPLQYPLLLQGGEPCPSPMAAAPGVCQAPLMQPAARKTGARRRRRSLRVLLPPPPALPRSRHRSLSLLQATIQQAELSAAAAARAQPLRLRRRV